MIGDSPDQVPVVPVITVPNGNAFGCAAESAAYAEVHRPVRKQCPAGDASDAVEPTKLIAVSCDLSVTVAPTSAGWTA